MTYAATLPINHILMLPDFWSLRFGEIDYPSSLSACADAPRILYGCGKLSRARAIALVGSRAASRVGCERALKTAQALVKSGFTVISGGALGIDAAAHRGALQADGATVAVLGTGLDTLYPARNRSLLQEIAKCGALVTPFAQGQVIRRGNFPRRNRIIAGLTEAVVVVEAGARSGALSTACAAQDYGRRVYVYAESPGTYRLLAQGASVIHSPEHLLAILSGADIDQPTPKPQGRVESILLNVLTADPQPIDKVARTVELPTGQVQASLLLLELGGQAVRTSVGYARIPNN